MAITLPTKKTSARRDVSKITMLLYGAPKIGKSTFCSRIDDALFIATEPGLAYLDTFNVICKSWQDIKDAMEKDFYKNIDKIIAESACNLSRMNVNFPDDREIIKKHICKKLCCRALTWQQIESASCRTTREVMQSLLKSAYIERYCAIQAGNFNKPWFQDLEHFIIEAKKVLIECGIKELV